jgi:hypothetical protein
MLNKAHEGVLLWNEIDNLLSALGMPLLTDFRMATVDSTKLPSNCAGLTYEDLRSVFQNREIRTLHNFAYNFRSAADNVRAFFAALEFIIDGRLTFEQVTAVRRSFDYMVTSGLEANNAEAQNRLSSDRPSTTDSTSVASPKSGSATASVDYRLPKKPDVLVNAMIRCGRAVAKSAVVQWLAETRFDDPRVIQLHEIFSLFPLTRVLERQITDANFTASTPEDRYLTVGARTHRERQLDLLEQEFREQAIETARSARRSQSLASANAKMEQSQPKGEHSQEEVVAAILSGQPLKRVKEKTLTETKLEMFDRIKTLLTDMEIQVQLNRAGRSINRMCRQAHNEANAGSANSLAMYRKRARGEPQLEWDRMSLAESSSGTKNEKDMAFNVQKFEDFVGLRSKRDNAMLRKVNSKEESPPEKSADDRKRIAKLRHSLDTPSSMGEFTGGLLTQPVEMLGRPNILRQTTRPASPGRQDDTIVLNKEVVAEVKQGKISPSRVESYGPNISVIVPRIDLRKVDKMLDQYESRVTETARQSRILMEANHVRPRTADAPSSSSATRPLSARPMIDVTNVDVQSLTRPSTSGFSQESRKISSVASSARRPSTSQSSSRSHVPQLTLLDSGTSVNFPSGRATPAERAITPDGRSMSRASEVAFVPPQPSQPSLSPRVRMLMVRSAQQVHGKTEVPKLASLQMPQTLPQPPQTARPEGAASARHAKVRAMAEAVSSRITTLDGQRRKEEAYKATMEHIRKASRQERPMNCMSMDIVKSLRPQSSSQSVRQSGAWTSR